MAVKTADLPAPSSTRPRWVPSTTTQIFIGLRRRRRDWLPLALVGRQRRPRRRRRREHQADRRHIPADDQDDHRAAAVLHAGDRDRRDRRPQGDGANRLEGGHLLRDRHDHRALSRAGPRERLPAGCGSPGPGVSEHRGDRQPQAARRVGTAHASLPDVGRAGDGGRGDPAARRVLDLLRNRGGGDWEERAADHRRPREHRAGDVQVHRLRDALRAPGGDGGHRRDGGKDGARHPVRRSASSCC